MEHLNSHNHSTRGNGYRKNQQSTLQNIGPQDPQKTPTHGYECGMPKGININVPEYPKGYESVDKSTTCNSQNKCFMST